MLFCCSEMIDYINSEPWKMMLGHNGTENFKYSILTIRLSSRFSLFSPSIVMKMNLSKLQRQMYEWNRQSYLLVLQRKSSLCPVTSVMKLSALYEHLFPFSHFKILMTPWFNLKECWEGSLTIFPRLMVEIKLIKLSKRLRHACVFIKVLMLI